jgi:hypothetical protein
LLYDILRIKISIATNMATIRPLYTALCRGKVTYLYPVLVGNYTQEHFFSLVVLFYLLQFSRFSVEVCNFLLITLIDTPQSVGLPWTRDQLVAETST